MFGTFTLERDECTESKNEKKENLELMRVEKKMFKYAYVLADGRTESVGLEFVLLKRRVICMFQIR